MLRSSVHVSDLVQDGNYVVLELYWSFSTIILHHLRSSLPDSDTTQASNVRDYIQKVRRVEVSKQWSLEISPLSDAIRNQVYHSSH